MADFAVATLGKEGVITDPIRGLNYLMSCFFFSKFSQTTQYRGSVISLSKIIQTDGNDPSGFTDAMERNLTEFLYRHFTVVSVTCSVITEEDNPDLGISLDVSVTMENDLNSGTIDLGYALTIGEGKFKKIIDKLNNEVMYT